MECISRFRFNREMWETANSVAWMVQVVAASIAEFEGLKHLAMLLSSVSTVLQLCADIRCRCAEHSPVPPLEPAETTNSEDVPNGSEVGK